jgi:hypothetical protein
VRGQHVAGDSAFLTEMPPLRFSRSGQGEHQT